MKHEKAILTLLLLIVVTFGISWGATVGLYKLVTLCFGWPFSLPVATGIWIVWLAVYGLFNRKER